MNNPPNSICILRLSAIGDVTHMVPIAHTIQKYWPKTKLTWVIGKNEAGLVSDIEGIEFIVFDKSDSIRSYRSIAKQMKVKSFDILICAQVSLRANYISKLIPAKLKLGYDKLRAKDFHSLFINESIEYTPEQHVLDSFFSFIEHIGLKERELAWNYVIPPYAHEFAEQHIDKKRLNIIISPCSSHPKRNWSSTSYAEVADYAIQVFDAHIILCGGPSDIENALGKEIQKHMQKKATNLIGKDNLKKFLALLKRADVIITPDSGPAHMATGVDTPVLGLYAATNPKRSGPYLSIDNCINKYNQAAEKFSNKTASELKWGTKLEHEGVMDLIHTKEVIEKLKHILQSQKRKNISI